MNTSRTSIFRFIATSLFASLALGCGGGGGGGDSFVGAAEVNLTVSPNSIDTNDRARVTIRIKNVIDNGILLKVRFSPKLSYAVNTSKLKLDNEDTTTPSEPTVTAESSSWKYLVFFLSRAQFGDTSNGSSTSDQTASEPASLTFEIIGNGKLVDGIIEADADVNDPTVPDSQEFNVSSPGFESQSDASIQVIQ